MTSGRTECKCLVRVYTGPIQSPNGLAYYRPYALQWMWPVPLAIGIFFAPESPWWLVRKGNLEEAKKSLLRLTSPERDPDFDADETIAMMVHTSALEERVRSPRLV
jgi:MFS transporter, SP family, general alpha glucoside:H+ symporter